VTDNTGKVTTTFNASAPGNSIVMATNGTVNGSATVTVTTQNFSLTPTPVSIVNGTIMGTVTNVSSSLPISGATITANGMTATADANGNYSISIAADTYTVTASANGFESNTKTGVVVTSGNVTKQNFALTPTILVPINPVVITLNVSPSDAGIATITSPIGTTTTSTSTEITIPSDSKVTFNVTPNDGYRFDRFVDKWNGNTFTTSLNPWTVTMESNDVVTAVLVPIAKNTVVDTIRVSPAGAGTVQAVSAVGTTTTPPTTTLNIPVNSEVMFKAIPNEGFKFDHWLDTWGISSSFMTNQNPWTDTMSSSDITTAVFVPIS
jgi:hypothetical protein